MFMDGIVTNTKKRGRRKKSTRSRRQETFTVSARMKEKNAERRKRTATVVLLMIVLPGLGWVTYAGLSAARRYLFTENDRFTVEQWEFHSDGPLLTERHIREYGDLTDPANLFAINLGDVRRRLESVPVIQSAAVSRQLPDTLVIRVNERLAVARLGANDRLSLAVDEEGHVLGPGSLRPNLPTIVGLRQPGIRPGVIVTDSLFQDALRVLELCNRPQVSEHIRIRSINVSDSENLDIRLSTGEQVQITRSYLEPRLIELVGIVADEKKRGRVARQINMTGDSSIPPVVQH